MPAPERRTAEHRRDRCAGRERAGRIVDLFTGEIIKQTPNAGADAAATICTALGGAPAT
jgi:hypothetical protein